MENSILTKIWIEKKVAYHYKYNSEHEASGRERIDGPLWLSHTGIDLVGSEKIARKG
jgi:hypothetical protein